ncbi:uncharacterized protein [Palaemon carinicauda]|uniref:uncharacterized protein n=1 Tax=Palaemon carinicauda TaxID=392227 RepID=UPI0035B5E12B
MAKLSYFQRSIWAVCILWAGASAAPSFEVNSNYIRAEPTVEWAKDDVIRRTVEKIDEKLFRPNDYAVVMPESGEEEDPVSRLLFALQKSNRKASDFQNNDGPLSLEDDSPSQEEEGPFDVEGIGSSLRQKRSASNGDTSKENGRSQEKTPSKESEQDPVDPTKAAKKMKKRSWESHEANGCQESKEDPHDRSTGHESQEDIRSRERCEQSLQGSKTNPSASPNAPVPNATVQKDTTATQSNATPGTSITQYTTDQNTTQNTATPNNTTSPDINATQGTTAQNTTATQDTTQQNTTTLNGTATQNIAVSGATPPSTITNTSSANQTSNSAGITFPNNSTSNTNTDNASGTNPIPPGGTTDSLTISPSETISSTNP